MPLTESWYARDARSWTCEAPDAAAADFHRQLPGYAPTPLVEVPDLAAELGVGLAAADGGLALVTATDGNHGRAVARTARLLGLPARVYVPDPVPGIVIERIRAEGARVTVVGADYDGAVAAARADADDGAVLVQDTAWPALAALRAALTGNGALSRRRDLGLDVPGDPPVAVCLCTEGPLSV